MISTTDALESLTPKAKWILRDNVLEWHDSIQIRPTEAEIDTEIIRLRAEYDAQEYARNRKAEYPAWDMQLDYIFHNGIDKWKEDIVQPVKDKYPKPE